MRLKGTSDLTQRQGLFAVHIWSGWTGTLESIPLWEAPKGNKRPGRYDVDSPAVATGDIQWSSVEGTNAPRAEFSFATPRTATRQGILPVWWLSGWMEVQDHQTQNSSQTGLFWDYQEDIIPVVSYLWDQCCWSRKWWQGWMKGIHPVHIICAP